MRSLRQDDSDWYESQPLSYPHQAQMEAQFAESQSGGKRHSAESDRLHTLPAFRESAAGNLIIRISIIAAALKGLLFCYI